MVVTIPAGVKPVLVFIRPAGQGIGAGEHEQGAKVKPMMTRIVAAGLFLACWGTAFEATSGSPRYYDLNILMHQPHPFAGPQAPPAWPSLLGPAPIAWPIPVVRPAPGTAPRYRRRADAPSFLGSPGGGPLSALSEVRGGILAHDRGPFTNNEEGGADINLEALFRSPDFLGSIGSPRPHLGFSVNTSGDTDQFYAGLTWEWQFWRRLFAGFGLGGAIHDGETETSRTDRKELGCRVLFRGSLELGYRLTRRHGVSLFYDRISNLDICDHDEGLETAGVRYGYRF